MIWGSACTGCTLAAAPLPPLYFECRCERHSTWHRRLLGPRCNAEPALLRGILGADAGACTGSKTYKFHSLTLAGVFVLVVNLPKETRDILIVNSEIRTELHHQSSPFQKLTHTSPIIIGVPHKWRTIIWEYYLFHFFIKDGHNIETPKFTCRLGSRKKE